MCGDEGGVGGDRRGPMQRGGGQALVVVVPAFLNISFVHVDPSRRPSGPRGRWRGPQGAQSTPSFN